MLKPLRLVGIGLTLTMFSGSVIADACSDFVTAVSWLDRADKAQQTAESGSSELADAMANGLQARYALQAALAAIRETIAIGPAAETLRALDAASSWTITAFWRVNEWNNGDTQTFETLLLHLDEARIALKRAHHEAAAGVCILQAEEN